MRNQSIFLQMVSGFFLIVCIVIVGSSVVYYRYASQALVEKTTAYLQEQVFQMQTKLDLVLREYDQTSLAIAFQPTVQEFLEQRNKGLEITVMEGDLGEQLRRRNTIGNSFKVQLLDNQHTLYESSEDSIVTRWRDGADLVDQPWYSLIDESQGRMLWMSTHGWRQGSPTPILVGARTVNDWNKFYKLGSMLLIIPIDQLGRSIEASSDSRLGELVIADAFGHIVYSPDRSDIGTVIDPALARRFEDAKDGTPLLIQDYSSYIVHTRSAYSQWNVIMSIEEDILLQDFNHVKSVVIPLALVGVLASLSFCLFFSWSISRPIRLLARRMDQLEDGKVFPFVGNVGNKELDILYRSFNHLVENLNQTIRHLSEKEISEQNAQILSLKAQFNPHFLYNTLNVIYWKSVRIGSPDIGKMVLELSDLLRYSIQPSSEFVTIEEDLLQIKRFVSLLEARHGAKLQVKTEIDPSLRSFRIMKLLLQPLIENAITHGLEPSDQELWLVQLRICRQGDGLSLQVEDNGVGMPAYARETAFLREAGQAKEMLHTGLGLMNLHQRCRLIYGDRYAISLDDSPLGGLRVRIYIPDPPIEMKRE